MKPWVRITSHVNPPLIVSYTLREFLESNEEDLSDKQIADLVRGLPIRLGGGAAPIVDVEPMLECTNRGGYGFDMALARDGRP